MSETSLQPDPTLQLRDHVRSVLASSSVPTAALGELAEELYGHLWQRWQDAMAAGASASEAVETAIRSFGRASQIGPEMTGAYHSRLYATTIGALLPAAVPPRGQPAGYVRLRLLLVLIAAFQFALVPILLSLTPARAIVLVAGSGLAFGLSVLAFQAFGRAQRWALRYAQFVLVIVLVEGAATLFSPPPGGFTIPILGLFGLWALGPAIGSQTAEWFSHSPPLGRGLRVGLAAAAVAGFAVPPLATVMPDPTQVSPSDLDLRVTAVCTRNASGGVTDVAVTTTMRWSRLDLLPYGLGQIDTPEQMMDRLAWNVLLAGGSQAPEWRTTWLTPDDANGRYVDDGVPPVWSPDGSVENAVAWRMVVFGPAVRPIGDAQFLPGGLHAGWTYVFQDHLQWLGSSVLPTDPLVAVWYVHLDGFTVQAIAPCGGSGSGVYVGPAKVIP